MAWLLAGYWTLAAVAICVATLLSIQVREHRRYARSRGGRVYSKPAPDRVVLFVPCKGADGDLEANLRSLFEQDHTNHELVFIVESVDDGAYDPLRRLMSANS